MSIIYKSAVIEMRENYFLQFMPHSQIYTANFERLGVANKAWVANRLWILRYFHLQLFPLSRTFNKIAERQSIYQHKKAMKTKNSLPRCFAV